MKQLLVEYNTIQYNNNLISEAADITKPLILKNVLLQRAEAKNQNGRRYPFEILMREAKAYKQNFVSQRRALGELDHPECFSPSAEILTQNGWKYIKDVQLGEQVATLNDDGVIEYHSISRIIDRPYEGKMISLKGKNIDTLVTPNHRFKVQNSKGIYSWITAQEIFDKSKETKITHLTIPKTGMWNGVLYQEYVIDSVDLGKRATKKNREKQSRLLYLNASSWFEFLGIYLAEGHITQNSGYRIHITQKPGKKADRIREVINSMSLDLDWKENTTKTGTIKFTVHDARLWTYLSKLGNKYTKFIPQDIKNSHVDHLQHLLDGYLLGDGSVINYNGYERRSIFSVSNQLMEDFQEICLKLGIASRIKQQVSKKAYVYAGHEILPENKSPLYRLWLDTSEAIHLDFRFLNVEEVDYNGSIHCVTVQNDTFYCRDNGKSFWTGNSPVVNLKNVCSNVTDIWFDGNDVMGNIEILSTPAGNIVRELIKNNIRLGVSSRGMGSVKELGFENEVEVQEDFNLICFDIVSNPSTYGAFINESARPQIINPYAKVDSLIHSFLSEIK
jgi:hypothetical protein